MRISKFLAVGAAMVVAAMPLTAQNQANDPSARLREVLPADVAEHVLSVIATARSRGLPGEALENRALKFAARGVPARDIERSIVEQAARMGAVRDTLQRTRGRKPAGDEVEAGAEAMRQGVDGKQVSELAKSAPSGRSLAVPLFVIGSLVDRGLPSDSALARVLARMTARASDRELEQLPGTVGSAQRSDNARGGGVANRPVDPATRGQGTRPTTAPPSGRPVAGPPAGVPANGGNPARPTPPAKGTTPTKRP